MALLGLAIAGCSDDAGSGDVEFTVWGEEYIEDGIPAETFEDGWSAKFSEFLIVVGEVTVADTSAGDGDHISGSQLFNLVTPGPHDLGRLDGLEARRWDTVGYEVRAIDADTELHASASADDLATMRARDYSVYVAGTARKGSETKNFAWGFQNSTRYTRCVSEAEGREQHGVVVTNGGTEHVELTIHGDHFFYDDLASPNALLRFAPIAKADVNEDGDVTLDELAAVKLVEIQDGPYGTGGAGHVDDLGAFVRGLTASLGHFRGEGHCVASDL
jgi:hypothetical protein